MRTTIGVKLTAINGMAVGALVCVGLVAIIGFRQLEGIGRNLYERSFVETALTSDLAVAFQKQRALTGRAPAEMDLGRLAEQRAQFEALGAEMDGRIRNHIETFTDSDTNTRTLAIAEAMVDYGKASIKVFDLASVFAQEDAIRQLTRHGIQVNTHSNWSS